jgi:hypothetical protein
MKATILEYLGLVNEGVLVLIIISNNDKNYECTFYYDSKDILLTISEDMEIDLGHKIEEDENYIEILKYILHDITPYNEIKGKLKKISLY